MTEPSTPTTTAATPASPARENIVKARPRASLSLSKQHATLPKGFAIPPLSSPNSAPSSEAGTLFSSTTPTSTGGTGSGMKKSSTLQSTLQALRASAAASSSAKSTTPAATAASPPIQSPISSPTSTDAGLLSPTLSTGSKSSTSATMQARRQSILEKKAMMSRTLDPKTMAAAIAANKESATNGGTPRTSLKSSAPDSAASTSKLRKSLGFQPRTSVIDSLTPRTSLVVTTTAPQIGRGHERAGSEGGANNVSTIDETSEDGDVVGAIPKTKATPRLSIKNAVPSATGSDSGGPNRRLSVHQPTLQQLQQQQYAHNNHATSSPNAPPPFSDGPYDPLNFATAESLASRAGGTDRQNIQVVVRCRPFIRNESGGNDGANKKSVFLSGQNVTTAWKAEKKVFSYDHVFSDDAQQADVYRECAGALIDQALQGYNATIFAYGQTGSGKTHTLFGDLTESSGSGGIVPHAIDHIFSFINSQQHITASSNGSSESDSAAPNNLSPLGEIQYLVALSFLEIYNEQVHDLLSFSGSNINLDVREDTATSSFHVPNLTKHIVTNRTELIQLIQRGNSNRKTTATIMNEYSSRSHSMLTLTIEKSFKRKTDAESMADDMSQSDATDGTLVVQSKLNLVDLAGSERLTTSGKDTTGKETMAINLSLSTLANVIAALTSNNDKVHIPYRDSKLTRLLKDSLGGNAKTMMVACINPTEASLPETLSTLRYASRAKKIVNKAKINLDPKDALLKALHEEIQKLKENLIEKNKMALRMFHLVNDLQVNTTDEKTINLNDTIPPTWLNGTDSVTTTANSETIVQPSTIPPTSTPLTTIHPKAKPIPPANSSIDSPPTSPDTEPSTPVEEKKLDEPPLSSSSNPLVGEGLLQLSSSPTSDTATTTAPTTATATIDQSVSAPTTVTTTPPRKSTLPSLAHIDYEASEKLLADPFAHVLSSPSGTVAFTYQQAKDMQLKAHERGSSIDLDTAVNQAQLIAALNHNAPNGDAITQLSESDQALTDDPLSLPGKSFYLSFKANVIKLYSSLMDAQTQLTKKQSQFAKAVDHIKSLEEALRQMRDAESSEPEADAPKAIQTEDIQLLVPTDATATTTADTSQAQTSSNDTKNESRSESTLPPESTAPTSPSHTLAIPDNVSPFSPVSPTDVLVEATAQLKTVTTPRNSSTSATHTPLKGVSRRASLVAINSLLNRTNTVYGQASLTTPGGTTTAMSTPQDDTIADLELELKTEKQRYLQLQTTLESVRATLEERDVELTTLRTTHAKEKADELARAARALQKVQDEAVDRENRLEESLEKQRMSEDILGQMLSEHQAKLEGGDTNTPLVDMSNFEAKLIYLRNLLQTNQEQSALIPKLTATIQEHERHIHQVEKERNDATTQLEEYRLLTEQLRSNEIDQANKRVSEMSSSFENEINQRVEEAVAKLRIEHELITSQHVTNNADLQLQIAALDHERSSLLSTIEKLGTISPVAPSPSTTAPPTDSVSPAQQSISPQQTEQWLQQTAELQNNILELTNEIQELRNSKRELVKNSAQELKRMRMELLQMKGIPTPIEREATIELEYRSPPPSTTNTNNHTNATAHHGRKSCVIQ